MAGLTQEQFLASWARHGNPKPVADELGITIRNAYAWRKKLSDRGHHLPTRAEPGYEARSKYLDSGWTFPLEKPLWMHDGTVVVTSDWHIWPGMISTAYRALLEVIKEVKPRAKIVNGDVFDGGSIGRHPPHGWSDRPSPVEELHACQERLGELEQALPRGCERIWTVGNHDVRFERSLASRVPEFSGLDALRLAHHFPAWEFFWSVKINWDSQQPVIVLHDNAMGIHAAYNNALRSGVTMITGHTHQLEAKPVTDLRGRRWGVQTGTMAELNWPQFEYQGARPSLACSGFAVLTFRDGELLAPEVCEVRNGKAYFRGKVVA